MRVRGSVCSAHRGHSLLAIPERIWFPRRMHFEPLVAMAMAIAQPLPEPGQQPSSPSAPPSPELIEGWEVSREAGPPTRDCAGLGETMVRALNPPEREEAVRRLEKDIALPLGEAEAARLLRRGIERGKPLATALLEERLDQLRSVRDCIMLRRRDRCRPENKDVGWGPLNEEKLAELTADHERGDHRNYRPYLVRGVAKFGDGHGGPPYMIAALCGRDLFLVAHVFSYTVPPSVRVPAIVFLPRPPERIWAWVEVAM